ncbi:restriction endonuclease subunit S [Achromobacter xylosoxidans]
MKNLPQGWEKVPVTEIVALHDARRVPLNAAQRAEMKGPIPYYGANGLVGYVNDYLFDGDYVLLAEDGGYFDDPRRGVAYEASGKFWVNNHAHILQPLGGISTRFLRHQLNATNWLPYVGGSTRPKLTQGGLQQAQVPVPPLPEQQRILAKIDCLTGKSRRARDHLDHIPRLVEKYKQAILTAAFRGDAELALVGDLITDIRYGTAKKCNYDAGAVPVLRIPNVQRGRIDLGDIKSADFDAKDLMKLELRIGDILVIRSNGSLDLVGRSAVVDDRAAGMLFAGYLIRLRLDPSRCLPEYLHWFLQSSVARKIITNAAKSTSGVHNVNAQELQALELPLPSIAVQKERIGSIESAFTWIDRLTVDTTNARKLIDRLDQSMLTKAFKGELVPQDPTDEPASALLERIRAERVTVPKAKRGHKKAA